jgi:hypothetical protein
MTGNITFVPNIPQTDDNPSDSQPNLLINTNAEPSIWGVDHIPFNVNYSGTHVQNTYLGFSLSAFPSGASATASIAYPAAGITKNTTAQYYFKNMDATFPLSAIKAFGSFLTSNTPFPYNPTILTGFNIKGNIVANVGPPITYAITLNDNVTPTGSNVCVLININNGTLTTPGNYFWSFSSNTLTISVANSVNINNTISFAILQI